MYKKSCVKVYIFFWWFSDSFYRTDNAYDTKKEEKLTPQTYQTTLATLYILNNWWIFMIKILSSYNQYLAMI